MSESGSPFILFFSLERWDDIWRRNQFICAGLLERYPGLQILWVNPPVDAFADPKWVEYLFNGVRAFPGVTGLWTIDLVKPLPNMVGRNFNQTAYCRKVRTALSKLAHDDPIVWINHHDMAPIVRALGLSVSVYDVTDDWTAASLSPRRRATVVNNDQWLVDNAKHVIVCSSRLKELKSGARTLHLIPNAVDGRRYHPDQLARLATPVELSSLTGPIAGYTGTLHEDRLDVDLVCELARQLADITFVFIGPNSLSRASELKLTDHDNIKLLGAKPYAQLPAYMGVFDICIVPHVVSEFTDSLDPLKLYEYFATGLPVVSTRCAGFRDFPDLVQLTADAGEMSSAIRNALERPEAQHLSEARLSLAAENGWAQRIMQIESILRLDCNADVFKLV